MRAEHAGFVVCGECGGDPSRPSRPMPDHGTPDRYLQPGEYVLVKKVDGRWPMTNRVFDAIEDALVRETGSASMRTIETVVETYLDALAGGEQP